MDWNGNQNRVPVKKRGNGFAITSLVLGILSISLFCTLFSPVLSALSLIFGIIYLVSYVPERKSFAITGIILAAASILMFIISINILMNSAALHSIRNADPATLLQEYLKFVRDSGYGDLINTLN